MTLKVANRCPFLRPSSKAYNFVNNDLSNYCYSILISFFIVISIFISFLSFYIIIIIITIIIIIIIIYFF